MTVPGVDHFPSGVPERHGPVPRDGSSNLVEVYPATALKVWGQQPTGYKGKKGAGKRARLVDWFRGIIASWLTTTQGAWRLCLDSDDLPDAFAASLAARAAAVGLCRRIPESLIPSAQREGWVAAPLPNSLGGLPTAS